MLKNIKISTLKKELLIVEAKDEKIAWAIIFQKYGVKAVSDYTLLGSPDEIKEIDVVDLVERTGLGNPSYSGEWYECYENPDAMYSKAKDSFNSALEKNIFWVNPEPYPSPYDPRSKTGRFEHGEELEKAERVWKEAQEKTFDKKRTLIFAKN